MDKKFIVIKESAQFLVTLIVDQKNVTNRAYLSTFST